MIGRKTLETPTRRFSAPQAVGLLWAVLVVTAALHVPGFGGYWISDDFGNIHQLYAWDSADRLWQGLAERMREGNTPAGAFFRPGTQAVRGLTWLLAGDTFAAWFALSLLLHLVNTWLLMRLVLRLSAGTAGANASAALAGLLFGLSPLSSEGVYWVAAGADAWVTLLVLGALHTWFGTRPLLAPALFLLALGFKESAAVLPIQLLVLLLALPRDQRDRGRALATAICLVFLVAYFAGRIGLFGNGWRVYTEGTHAGLAEAFGSIPAWWRGLSGTAPLLGATYLFLVALTATWSLAGARQRLTLGLAVAAAGLCLATLLNLGALLPSGEGGRLLLTPLAWLALAIGVALSHLSGRAQQGCRWALGVAILAGAGLLSTQYAELRDTQAATRSLVRSIGPWTEQHPGTTLLLLPETRGRLPVLRNAQSGLVLPPLQTRPLLHRALPTLETELAARHAQIESGLLTRLDTLQPEWVDWRVVAQLLVPAAARWPEHYACWSWTTKDIRALTAPPAYSNEHAWLAHLAAQARQVCRIDIPLRPHVTER